MIHSIEPHQRGKWPDVGLAKLVAQQIARSRQFRLPRVHDLDEDMTAVTFFQPTICAGMYMPGVVR
jgi:hypothetical protein